MRLRPCARLVILLFAIGVGSACTKTVPIAPSVDLPRLPPGLTGAVLPLHFRLDRGYVGHEPCTLFFAREGALKLVRLQFMQEQDLVFALIDPGRYRIKALSCGRYHWDFLARRLPPFQVFFGRISLLGAVTLEAGADKQTAIRPLGRGHDRDEAQRFFAQAPAEAQARLVSAYTGQEIPPAALGAPAGWGQGELRFASGAPRKSQDSDFPSFQSCYQAESEVNALWLGNLQLEAHYSEGVLTEITGLHDSWSTFTERFKECVKTTLRAFRPPTRDGLRYTLHL